MAKRFGATTDLCKTETCSDKANCIHYLAYMERKNELNGNEVYLVECDKSLITLPKSNVGNIECRHCTSEGKCLIRNQIVCLMECRHCKEFSK